MNGNLNEEGKTFFFLLIERIKTVTLLYLKRMSTLFSLSLSAPESSRPLVTPIDSRGQRSRVILAVRLLKPPCVVTAWVWTSSGSSCGLRSVLLLLCCYEPSQQKILWGPSQSDFERLPGLKRCLFLMSDFSASTGWRILHNIRRTNTPLWSSFHDLPATPGWKHFTFRSLTESTDGFSGSTSTVSDKDSWLCRLKNTSSFYFQPSVKRLSGKICPQGHWFILSLAIWS